MDRDQLVVMITRLVSGGATVEGAVRSLEMMGPRKEDLLAARAEYERKVLRIRSLKVPKALEDTGLGPAWYTGPKDGDLFWPALRGSLDRAGLPESAIISVDDASTKIVSYLAPPGAPAISIRGLVVGHVQSGKTTSFMSVIAKAADVGYRLFVVLSGIHNSLRWQTQQRLDEQLVAPVEAQWFKLTDELDFRSPGNVNFLLGDPDKRLVAVVKKNPSRLRALNRWLNGAAPETILSCPILVIDDEADQASIDVGTPEQRSRINQLILELLRGKRIPERKAAYVGYTASPFANLLINPAFLEDLYPRDFIVDLARPDDHFGTEVIFGRDMATPEEEESASEGYDVVRIVPEDEVAALRPPSGKDKRTAWVPEVTPSLSSALEWFCLATAARRARGSSGTAHSTMLVHTTVLTEAQEQFGPAIHACLESLASKVEAGDSGELQRLRNHWEVEQERLPPDVVNQTPVTFDALVQHLPSVLTDVEVVIDNYRSQRRLDYGVSDENGRGRTVVVVGGNTLSRGLTLEGLVASFFVRTASAYDTLLQMGRWFGYRRGYEDLPRIWMTAQLRDWFIWLATVENEIRVDISRFEAEHLTPREFAVRIRTHPKMAVTSALKMRHAVKAVVSYGGRRIQTILFNHRDRDWLQANLTAGRALVSDAIHAGCKPEFLTHGKVRVTSVPVGAIRRFLSTYRFHEAAKDLQREPLLAYINDRNTAGALLNWNVMIMGSDLAGLGTVSLGLSDPVGLINRSRVDIPGLPHANIKTLMSKIDRVADLDRSGEDLGDLSEEVLQKMRPADIGLLLLYPISKDSTPGRTARGRQRRQALAAVDDVLGVALVFPSAPEDSEEEYVSAPLSGFEEEELEVDLDAVDEEREGAEES